MMENESMKTTQKNETKSPLTSNNHQFNIFSQEQKIRKVRLLHSRVVKQSQKLIHLQANYMQKMYKS